MSSKSAVIPGSAAEKALRKMKLKEKQKHARVAGKRTAAQMYFDDAAEQSGGESESVNTEDGSTVDGADNEYDLTDNFLVSDTEALRETAGESRGPRVFLEGIDDAESDQEDEDDDVSDKRLVPSEPVPKRQRLQKKVPKARAKPLLADRIGVNQKMASARTTTKHPARHHQITYHSSGRAVMGDIIDGDSDIEDSSEGGGGKSLFARERAIENKRCDKDPTARIDGSKDNLFSNITVAKLYDELGYIKVNFSDMSIADLDYIIDHLYNMWLMGDNRGTMTEIRKQYTESVVGQDAAVGGDVGANREARDAFRKRARTAASMQFGTGVMTNDNADPNVSEFDVNDMLAGGEVMETSDEEEDNFDERQNKARSEAFVAAMERVGIDMSDALDIAAHAENPWLISSEQQRDIVDRYYPQYAMRYSEEEFSTERLENMAFRNFGIDRSNPAELSRCSVDYVDRMMNTIYRYVYMLQRQLFLMSNDPKQTHFSGSMHGDKMNEIYMHKLRALFWQIHYARHLVLIVTSASEGTRMGAQRTDVPLAVQALGIRNTPNGTDVRDGMQHHQKLFFKCLMEAHVKNWRRVDDKIYEEVRSGVNGTNAYRLRCTIEEFTYQLPDPVVDPEGFNLYTSSAKTIGWTIQMLTKMHYDHIFPDLKRCQTQWSFKQGVYCGETDRFWPYDEQRTYEDPESPFVRGIASARWLKMDFPMELMQEPYISNPSKIDVESFGKIFKSQRFSEDQIDWIWTFIGRMYYPVRAKDNWQVMFWLKGQSGTGKSTIAKGVTNAYDFNDVGILGNMVEQTFGLETLYNKFIVVAPEIKKNFKLDLATFQAMVAGDPVMVARKNKSAKILQAWTAQLLMCSNDFPAWIDSAGAIMRRVMCLIFKYSIPPDQRDCNLDTKVLNDLPRQIVKANRHYISTVNRYNKGEDVWSIVAREFREATQQVRRQSNPLANFIEKVVVITGIKDEDNCVSMETFKLLFSADSSNESKNSRSNLALEDQLRSWEDLAVEHDSTVKKDFVYGCKLHLRNARDILKNDDWVPEDSETAYMDEAEYVEFYQSVNAKKQAEAEKHKTWRDAEREASAWEEGDEEESEESRVQKQKQQQQRTKKTKAKRPSPLAQLTKGASARKRTLVAIESDDEDESGGNSRNPAKKPKRI